MDDNINISDVWEITDQKRLADLAKTAKDVFIRFAAVKALQDQDALADIALNVNHEKIQTSAIKKLENQAVLAEIATNNNNNIIRLEAAKRLKDKELRDKILNDILENCQNYVVKWETLTALGEEERAEKFLEEVALHGQNHYIRRGAVKLLKDKVRAKNFLFEMIKQSQDQKEYCCALMDLKEENLLQTNEDEALFQVACVKIAKEMRVVDQDTAILYSACIDFLADQALANECRAKLILNKCNKQVQLQCIFNIDADKYQSLLEQVALSDTLPVNRFFAAERLKDEELAHRIFIDLLDSGDVYAAGWAHEKLNESKYDSFDEKSSDFPSKRF